ncbi:hypothetical protein GCM10007079_28840 [Nocardiopsis terrae]|uniref:Uncharacterized protein n=1 Tax=Nocardiopsis terrae TaxID=372655 RepID=A0ABR9HES8_9ACTN|nr:hypothetical protein [Nocardiopsis terrae]MBE1457514.1 hypothetical protein [Nocardiopsis terrae]GHC85707.1 hypothetical protein GCM10007079_28840 [Nocardiopsis terrae]
MPTPRRNEQLPRCEHERPASDSVAGPALAPEDLVPHLLGLARALRQGDGRTVPGARPRQSPI